MNKFVFDGERWIKDPLGVETVSDGYWGENSILRLTRELQFPNLR